MAPDGVVVVLAGAGAVIGAGAVPSSSVCCLSFLFRCPSLAFGVTRCSFSFARSSSS